MKLYLVRHGDAVHPQIDPTSPLSREGREEVRQVASAVADRVDGINVVWHSTKLRARETAEILADILCPKSELLERDGLTPNAPPDPIAAELSGMPGDLVIVSHLPFLPHLSEILLDSPVEFRTAGFACLEANDSVDWKLAWTLDPDDLS